MSWSDLEVCLITAGPLQDPLLDLFPQVMVGKQWINRQLRMP
jgi:hypothetical protein